MILAGNFVYLFAVRRVALTSAHVSMLRVTPDHEIGLERLPRNSRFFGESVQVFFFFRSHFFLLFLNPPKVTCFFG